MTDREEALSELWEGVVEDIRLHLPLHRAVMTVRVVEGKVTKWYEVAFDKITKFVFSDNDPSVWTSAWIAEAVVRRQDNQEEVSINLSEIRNAMEITCEDVRITFLRSDED